MKNALNFLDISSILSGVFAVSVAQEIEGWLALVLTIISVVSVLIASVIRIIELVKQATSESSDGGKTVTSDELKDILDEVSRDITEVKDIVEKNDEDKE